MSINRARPHPEDASKIHPAKRPTIGVGTPPIPDLAAYVEHVVKQAPPLSMSQQDSLGVLLKGESA